LLPKAQKDRQSAKEPERLALEAERKKRQELEEKLASAERPPVAAPQTSKPHASLKTERRVALVIGNSTYKVSPLDNPVNDATDMAESLKKFGFQTTLLRNATMKLFPFSVTPPAGSRL